MVFLRCSLNVGVSKRMQHNWPNLCQVFLQIASGSSTSHLLVVEAAFGLREFSSYVWASPPEARPAGGRASDVEKIVRMKRVKHYGLGKSCVQDSFGWVVKMSEHRVLDSWVPEALLIISITKRCGLLSEVIRVAREAVHLEVRDEMGSDCGDESCR